MIAAGIFSMCGSRSSPRPGALFAAARPGGLGVVLYGMRPGRVPW